MLADGAADALRLPPACLPGRRPAWLRVGMPVSLAAAVTLAVGLGLYLSNRGGTGFGVNTTGWPAAEAPLTGFGVEMGGRLSRDITAPALDEEGYRDALARLDAALGQEQPPADALELATRAALSAGFADDAARYAERWVKAAPDHPGALNALGLARFLQNRYAEAQRSFEQAIALDAERASLHLNAAMAADQADAVEAAIAHLRQFIELSPAPPQRDAARRWLDRLQMN